MNEKRYCTIKESLVESCKEVKLIREGKLPEKTWKDLLKKSKKMGKGNSNGKCIR